MTEQELVERIGNGDQEAFRTFYERYISLVYRYIRFRIHSDQDAEELASEVFVKAWRSARSYEWRGAPVSAWLLRIAHNLIVDKYRKKRFSLTSLSTWLRSNGHQEYERIEDQDVISRAFETLSYEQQVILYLYFYESYSYEEIAKVLNKTANAVGVAKLRALKRLEKVFQSVDA
jgi:RNA polymerase sigma-70 factor, ECF subfamily